MKRLWLALAAYAGLAILASQTLSDEKIRWVTLAVLAMFFARTLAAGRQRSRPGE